MGAWSSVSLGDLFTLGNGVLGFIAITFILDRELLSAAGMIFLAMMMDGLDGYIARKFGSKHAMGQVLDSISDSISFVFAPALLVYAEIRTMSEGPLQNGFGLACAVAFLVAGLFRLARFSAGGYQLPHFVGIPAPAGALFLVLTCLLLGAAHGTEQEKFYFTITEAPWLVLGVGFLASFLMASEIPYPKIQGWMTPASALALLLAVLPFAAGLLLVGDQALYRAFSRIATGIALACTLVYVFGGPIYEKLKGSRSR